MENAKLAGQVAEAVLTARGAMRCVKSALQYENFGDGKQNLPQYVRTFEYSLAFDNDYIFVLDERGTYWSKSA